MVYISFKMGFCNILKETFKPPLLIFCITVTALAITLFAFSLSIEINNEKILNPDIHSWNSFFKTVSALGACLMPKYDRKIKPPLKVRGLHQSIQENLGLQRTTNITRVSFLTESSVVIENYDRNDYLHVVINAEELGFLKPDDNIEMVITLPKSNGKHKTSCVSVVGPSYLLPTVRNALPGCTHTKFDPKRKQELVLMSTAKLQEAGKCPSKQFGSLSFKEEEILNVYLSEMDTDLMQMHIFVMSSILCATVLLFFVYSVLRKFCKSERKLSVEEEKIVLEA